MEARIINKNFTQDQQGQPILEQDVVRSANGRYYTSNEVSSFHVKSDARCPTYGNCPYCWCAGPVGRMCNTCNRSDHGYLVLFIMKDSMQHIMDAEYLSQLFEAGMPLLVANADRTYAWCRTPYEELTSKMVQNYLDWKETDK